MWVFFGFLWCGEFTSPSDTEYDNRRHLSVSDVSVDSTNLTIIAINLKVTKTDQFGAGTTVYLGRTSTSICPVSAVLQYLAVRPARDGPSHADLANISAILMQQ